MADQTQENQQIQRARRLSEQIARIKSSQPIHRPGAQKPSLREQIEQRMNRLKPRRTVAVPRPAAPNREAP
jgi:hypothetical protein